MLMPSEIEELRKMLEYTMRRYNELLKRVEQLENSNAPMYFVTNWEYDTITWVWRNTANTAYCTSASRRAIMWDINAGDLYRPADDRWISWSL